MSETISNIVAINEPKENNPVISITALPAFFLSFSAYLVIWLKNLLTALLCNQFIVIPAARHISVLMTVKNLLNIPLHFGIALFNKKFKDFLVPSLRNILLSEKPTAS